MNWSHDLGTDARYAIRSMRTSPAFAATAVACLALGIGANTAIFTVIHKVLFEDLPYPDADRLVTVGRPGRHSSASPQRYAYWARSDHGLAALTAYQAGTANLDGGDAPALVKTIAASRAYFRLFGAKPILGRTFSQEEDRPGGARVALLSDALWRRRFNADPGVLGRTVRLGNEPYSVVGVLSARFVPYPAADVWIPLQADPASTMQASVLTVAARLPPGMSLSEANARMAAIDGRFGRDHGLERGGAPEIEVAWMRESLAGEVRPLLLMLLGAVGLVLLVACANVANLLLARATARQKEIAIRAALGAGRGRLVRQFLTESIVLGAAGGAAGLLVGRLGLRGLLAITPGELPRAQEIAATSALDPRVASFALLLALATGALFGLFPAVRASRTVIGSAVHRSRALRALVAGEIAAALVLLTAALLLIRSFAAMHGLSAGFDATGVLTMEVSLSGARYERAADVDRFARRLTTRLEQIPGVESAAVASALPLFGHTDMVFRIPGRPNPGRLFDGDVQWRFITPEYFRALRIPLLAGRALAAHEPGKTVVISEAMARQFWPGENPVGETIDIGAGLNAGFEAGRAEIVGIAGDVRERLDHDRGAPVMYQLASQMPDRAIALMNHIEAAGILVRTRPGVPPASLARPVRQAIEQTDRLPVSHVRTMEQARWDSTPRHNFNLFLFGSFAAVATLLAAVGIYGVTAYGVGQRTREIGVRSALGATRADVFQWVLREALATASAGVLAGLAASFGLMRLIRSLLFGVGPSDALTLIAVPLIALAVALAAACMPALRASRIDPVEALRAE